MYIYSVKVRNKRLTLATPTNMQIANGGAAMPAFRPLHRWREIWLYIYISKI